MVHSEDVADGVLLSLDGEGGGIDDLGVPLVRDPAIPVLVVKLNQKILASFAKK